MPHSAIVAIDGPAGAGKSTVARQLAARLGFSMIDTGAIVDAKTIMLLQFAALNRVLERSAP